MAYIIDAILDEMAKDKAAAKLKELLKAAKPMLRKKSDSVEIVDEALSDLRGLTKELSELQPES